MRRSIDWHAVGVCGSEGKVCWMNATRTKYMTDEKNHDLEGRSRSRLGGVLFEFVF